MTTTGQIPVFFINMHDAVERRDWFEAQASRLGLTVERVDAVVGRQLPLETLERLKASIGSGTPMGPSEIGCFLSHRKAWERVFASDAPWAFVAEDDLHLADGAGDYFFSTDWIPEGADLIKVETTFRRCHMARTGAPAPDGRTLRRLLSLHGGSGGYFLSQQAARDALDSTRDVCGPSDHVLFNPEFSFFGAHAIYQIDPAIAVQDLLRREEKAGFLESGLAIERRAAPKQLQAKLVREVSRPIRQLGQAIANLVFRIRHGSRFKRVDYRL